MVGGSTTTYSLISFSFSKGLLGVLDVFESVRNGEHFELITIGVLLWHFVGLIYKAYKYQ